MKCKSCRACPLSFKMEDVYFAGCVLKVAVCRSSICYRDFLIWFIEQRLILYWFLVGSCILVLFFAKYHLRSQKVHGEEFATEHCPAIDRLIYDVARVQKFGNEVSNMFQLDYMVFIRLLSHARWATAVESDRGRRGGVLISWPNAGSRLRLLGGLNGNLEGQSRIPPLT